MKRFTVTSPTSGRYVVRAVDAAAALLAIVARDGLDPAAQPGGMYVQTSGVVAYYGGLRYTTGSL